MRVTVVVLMQHGIPLPDRDRPCGSGELRMAQVFDEVRRRWVTELRLLALDRGGRPTNVLAPIYDAHLVAVGGEGMTGTGFERTDRRQGAADVAQSWWVQLR